MAREKKFSFLPVRNEDLRRVYEVKETPYIRIYKAGTIVFPKKTLEHFNLKKGDLTYLRFYTDVSRRALAFKFLDKAKAEDLKEFRPLTISQTPATTFGSLTIKSILNKFGDWKTPVRCNLNVYDDSDQYITFGKLNYFIVPGKSTGDEQDEEETKGKPNNITCSCGRHFNSKISLYKHVNETGCEFTA